MQEAKAEKVKRLARSSFWHFRLYLHPRMKTGWFQQEVSENLQQFYQDYLDGKRPQLVIEAPPQNGKSTIVNDFLIWLIGKDSETDTKDLKIIYAAFSDALSTRSNRRIQRFTQLRRFKEVFPNFALKHKTQDLIMFGDDAYFRNTTTGGAITGESGDILCIDDPMKGREAANSATIRDKVWEWFTSDFKTRFSERGAFICILTRWHIDDLIGRLIQVDDSVKVLKYKAIAETDEPHRKKGEALFPEHKSLEFLLGVKKVMPSATWNSLYQQNPTLAAGNFFKPDFIKIIDALPSNLTYVRAWDLAATENGGDYTVGLKMGYDSINQVAYISNVVRGQYAPEDVEKLLLNTARSDGNQCNIKLPQDPGQAGKSQVVNLAKLLTGFSAEFGVVSGDKVTRASPVAAQCNAGNVYMLRGAWNTAFIEELRLFPNGVNDDQVDALSDAYNYFAIANTYATDGFISAADDSDYYNYRYRD